MTLIMKHFGFVETFRDTDPGHCGGSSRFLSNYDIFTEKVDLHLRRSSSVVCHDKVTTEIEPSNSEGRRVYGMNVPKFKAKAMSYAMLRRSQRFLAFYSISFPLGMPDDIGFKILNSALTQLRKNCGLKSYLWVMERQENTTIHYHMMTNDFIYVRDFNTIVAKSIEYYVQEGLCEWGRSSFEKYNGVDVKAVVSAKKTRSTVGRKEIIEKVTRYLAKYMSKEIKSEYHRVWHCSRLVSALFISVSFNNGIASYIFKEVTDGKKIYKRIQAEYCNIIFCATIHSDHWLETVGKLNEKVYEWFEEHGLW